MLAVVRCAAVAQVGSDGAQWCAEQALRGAAQIEANGSTRRERPEDWVRTAKTGCLRPGEGDAGGRAWCSWGEIPMRGRPLGANWRTSERTLRDIGSEKRFETRG